MTTTNNQPFEINYTPSEKQKQAFRLLQNSSKCKVLGYGGAKGGGKSSLSRAFLFARGMKYPTSRGLLLRKTYSDVYRNHVIKFCEEYKGCKFLSDKNEISLPNGAKIEIGYYENESSIERYQGVEYHTVVIDQAEQFPKKLYSIIRSCMRSAIVGLTPKMLLAFNWGGVGHKWLKKMFIDRIPDTNEDLSCVEFIKALVYDNKYLLSTDDEYVNTLKSLPEQLKKAYLEGDYNAFAGAFFQISPLSMEPPVQILKNLLPERLYGSLDHGTTHFTSFGLWYLHKDNTIHRLFTYLNNGQTARDHALEIFSRIRGFKYTHGLVPCKIFADPSIWTKYKLNEMQTKSVVDEYKDVFSSTKTEFIPANNDKKAGCDLMRSFFGIKDGLPRFYYWDMFNTELVDTIHAAVGDENHPEQYMKADGDDLIDELRYGVMGLYNEMNDLECTNNVRKKIDEYNARRNKMSWKTCSV